MMTICRPHDDVRPPSPPVSCWLTERVVTYRHPAVPHILYAVTSATPLPQPFVLGAGRAPPCRDCTIITQAAPLRRSLRRLSPPLTTESSSAIARSARHISAPTLLSTFLYAPTVRLRTRSHECTTITLVIIACTFSHLVFPCPRHCPSIHGPYTVCRQAVMPLALMHTKRSRSGG
jgi:hypothetical protein